METNKSPNLGFQTSHQLIQNLRKKRPNLTRLDIEKLFEESIQLTQIHRKLSEQNERLRKDFKKVQEAKIQRQSFISQVQKIVKEKSHELNTKNPQKPSCLVYKLQQKIFDLKQEIQSKNKAIRKLHVSKQNQILFRKQIDIECLKEINEFASSVGIESGEQDLVEDDNYQQIVWMDDYLQGQKIKVEQLENELEQEERESKRIMTDIACKKSELKKIKDIQRQYLTVQESYILEKKRKQEKMFDNKSYLTNLIKQRDIENGKFQILKQKRFKIQEQETIAVMKLQQKLQSLQKLYQSNKKHKTIIKPTSDRSIKPESTEQWVKRVSIQEVETIAKNINLCLALNGITQDIWINEFFKDELEMYSIQQVIKKLDEFPFCVENDQHKKLLARYFVEDIDNGLMLEDLNTSQSSPIIKSVMRKLIGFTKVYSCQEQQRYREGLGEKLGKFWPLVEQSIHIKQGVRNLITRQMLEDGLESAELQLNCDEVQYIVLYLFSWSKDVNKLELNKLGKIKELGIQSLQK